MASLDAPDEAPTTNGNEVRSEAGSILDDGRSSSLSEIEDESEQEDLDIEDAPASQNLEVDSEAETERLEQSPHTPGRHTAGAVPFEKSPSKLAQATSADDNGGQVDEQYSDSAISSPLASLEEPLDHEDEEPHSDAEHSASDGGGASLVHGIKRKRGESEEARGHVDASGEPLRKRTGSVKGEVSSAPLTDEESAGEEPEAMDASRESTVGPEPIPEPEAADEGDEEPLEAKPITKKALENRRGSRFAKLAEAAVADEEAADEHEDVEEADVAGEPENASEDEQAAEEIDEAEAERKNEEEFAKKMVAMDSLVELEKQFAILRDKLYDERIGEINKQLLQLNGPEPANAEYLEKMQVVIKHRDDKQDYEHKLLAFKIQSLKTKSVAERSQIHSAYYQTVRDIRERYLDFANEQFYKIQRDRFKPDESLPNYSIPFPERRSQQIAQQASYNREVSILAGMAKYVGFPAAPELTTARQSEIDEDLEKMGLPSQPARAPAAANGNTHPRQYSVTAEEQFLEQTPWANPQHPVHNRANRQFSGQNNADTIYATPATQKTTIDPNVTHGSASTIPENLSAQASSALNTPHDQDPLHGSADRGSLHRITSNGLPPRASVSPTETRKVSSVLQYRVDGKKQAEDGPGPAVHSPPHSRSIFNSPHTLHNASAQHDSLNRHQNSSPLTSVHSGITAGAGFNRFGTR